MPGDASKAAVASGRRGLANPATAHAPEGFGPGSAGAFARASGEAGKEIVVKIAIYAAAAAFALMTIAAPTVAAVKGGGSGGKSALEEHQAAQNNTSSGGSECSPSSPRRPAYCP
jgi:hypothetical protein